jgi:phospholipase C
VAGVALTVAVALAGTGPAGAARAAGGGGSAPTTGTTTPIKHFVTLMQENHTFDNYFGGYPGADGTPADVCMPRGGSGRCVRPWHIGNSTVEDLDHRPETVERQLDGGRMDGFVTAEAAALMDDPALTMGYYDRRDIPYYWNVADQYVLFDKNFTSARAGTLSNHLYWISGRPGPADERIPGKGFTAPTIFDRLQQAGVSWKFYVEGYDRSLTFRSRGLDDTGSQLIRCPLLDYARFVDDPALNRHIVPLEDYYRDLEAGTLPAVSYLVPSGSSEHPPGSPAAGQALVSNLVSGLMRSSSWSSSAFMWTYDESGGWYDHVRPPAVDRYGYGLRAPALLVSPYAKRGVVDHTQIDFTSQLKFIQRNWGLRPLAARDRAATGLDSAFDFHRSPRAPQFVSPDVSPPAVAVGGQGVVYLSYGIGALLAAAFGIGAAGRFRWPRPTRSTGGNR